MAIATSGFDLSYGASRTGPANKRRGERGLSGLAFLSRLHVILFLALSAISAVPVLILAYWVETSAMEKEVTAVREKHLLLAQNLSAALSRYVVDVKAGFKVAVSGAETHPDPESLSEMLESLSFRHVCIIDSTNRITTSLVSASNGAEPKVKNLELVARLREVAAQAGGEVVITDLMNNGEEAMFFVVQQLDGGRFALGALAPDYLREVQRSIAFGKLGHSMMVDAKGVVIAHPNKEWERISKDASKLSVVRKMMRGETGVATFYSPPMKADMIAGHTSVPETGWGVMVPQPMSELVDSANDTRLVAIGITVIGIMIASLIGWRLAGFLAKPIVSVEKAASAVAAGKLGAQVEQLPAYSPAELRSLAASFDQMMDSLRHRDEGLRLAVNQAKTASRAKSEFLANMSHELRTPLNGIIGFAEILRNQSYGPLGEQRYVEYVSDIHQAGGHLLEVINDVLDVTRLEAGELKPEVQDIDVEELVRDCLDATANRAHQADIKISCEVPENLPFLQADPVMTRQILLNLLSNAIKFTPEGGSVTVAADMQENNDLTLSVSDTGIGIAPEQIDFVVQPFSQVDSSLQRQFEGSGLGLFLSTTMAELQGATQKITSKLGEGTRVEIRFPGTQAA